MKIVTPLHLRGYRSIVRSQSNQTKLTGHLWLSELETQLVTKVIFPLNVEDVPLHVLLTGPMTARQILMVHECVRMRRGKVRQLLEWLMPRNVLYQHLCNQSGLREMEVRLLQLPEDDVLPAMTHHTEPDLVPAAPPASATQSDEHPDWSIEDGDVSDDDNSSVSNPVAHVAPEKGKESKPDSTPGFGPSTGMAGDNTGTGFTYVSTISINETSKASSGSVLGAAADSAEDQVAGVHIRSSGKGVGGYLPYTLEKAFPALFPYRRGGPSERRDVKCGMAESIAHLGRVSTGAFQGTEFTLTAYDLTECAAANKAAFVNCLQKSDSGHCRGELYAQMSPEDLRLLAYHMDECSQATKHKQPHPPLPQRLINSGITKQFMRSMHFAAGKMRHSDEFGREARKKLWAIMAEECKPSLFVTVNPDDTGSLLIHLLRGGHIDDAIPPLHIRTGYLTHFPGASALAFERFLEVLIGVIIGWDDVSKSSTAVGGLFGHPRAYFMAIEEQGRLSLHDHILLWLHGHDQLRERLLQKGGVEKLQVFLDRAFETTLPVPADKMRATTHCPARAGPQVPETASGLSDKDAAVRVAAPELSPSDVPGPEDMREAAPAEEQLMDATVDDDSQHRCARCGSDILTSQMGKSCGFCDLHFHKCCPGECDCLPAVVTSEPTPASTSPISITAAAAVSVLEPAVLSGPVPEQDHHIDLTATAVAPELEPVSNTDPPVPDPASVCNAPLGPHPTYFAEAHYFEHTLGDNPAILQCTSEHTKHTHSADDITDDMLSTWWAESRPNVPIPVTPEAITELKWGGVDNTSADIELLTCILIRRLNWHKASHMTTCGKSAKAQRTKLCRARLPADFTDTTVIEILHPGCAHVMARIKAMTKEQFDSIEWDLQDHCPTCSAPPLVSFLLRRAPGSAWMPQCSSLLTRVFGCNNNVQYVYNQLLGFYMGMYASKSSKENADSHDKAVEGFSKVCERQAQIDENNQRLVNAGVIPPPSSTVSEFTKGLRRLHAAWSSHTNTEQVGAPRAALFNLGYDGWLASRDSATLAPNAAIAHLLGEPLYHNTNSFGSSTPLVLDYIFRPEILEPLCWLEFVRNYERVRLPKGETDTVLEFLPGHPKSLDVGVAERLTWKYPQVNAMRNPDRDTLEAPTADGAQRTLYAQNALTLTVPFRTLADFGIEAAPLDDVAARGQKDAPVWPDWWAAWVSVRDTHVTVYGKTYLKNIQEHYTAVLCNKNRKDVDIVLQDELEMMYQADGGDNAMLDDQYIERLLHEIEDSAPRLPPSLNLEISQTYQAMTPYTLSAAAVSAACDAMPEQIKRARTGLDPDPASLPRALDIKQVRGDSVEQETFVDAVMESILPTAILKAIDEVDNRPPDPGPRQPFKRLESVRPTLAQMIRHYSFDPKQAEVFTMMGTVFLCRLCLLFVLPDALKDRIRARLNPLLASNDQLVHLLLGKGGTGKSHIIKAIQNLAYCWGATRCLVLCGTSGIAGCLIGGRTMHNVFGLGTDPSKQGRPTHQQVQLWQWVVLGICDEVSMMPAGWFYQMHRRGTQLFDNRPGFCGGVDWMFAGDFSQLGSVGTNLYERYHTKTKDGHRVKPNIKKGCDLWNKYVRSVSHLHHSHRHENADAVFQATLSAMHSRTVTTEMMQDFNAAIKITDERQSGPDAVYVTPGNRVREQVVKALYDANTRNAPGGADTPWKERGHILIQMSVYPRSKKRERTNLNQPQMRPQVARLIRTAPEKQFQGLAGEVGIQLAGDSCARSGIGPNDDKDCHCCGSYTCSKTVLQTSGIVKSMWMKALDVQLTPDAVVTWDEQRYTHIVQAIHVKAIIVKLLLGPLASKVMCPGLPPGVVALTPSICAVSPSIRGQTYRCSVVQVAMVSNRCLTGHKMQGMTVPSVRLISFLNHPSTKREWLYVACSRVPTLQGLYSEQPLSTLPRYWNKADLALDHEVARLYLMELETDVRIIEARQEVVPQELLDAIVTQSTVLAEVLNRLHYLKTRAWLTGPPEQSVHSTDKSKHRPWNTSNKATGVHSRVRVQPERPTAQPPRTTNARSPRKRQRTTGNTCSSSRVLFTTGNTCSSSRVLFTTDKAVPVSQAPVHEMLPEEIPTMDEQDATQVSTISVSSKCHTNTMIECQVYHHTSTTQPSYATLYTTVYQHNLVVRAT
jgi:hypothetical protein